MSLAIVVVFFLSMSPFVVYLSINLFSPDGTVCLSNDFRFVTQYLVHCNGTLNFFTYFIFNQSYRRGFLIILSRVFCSSGSLCRRKQEVELTSRFGQTHAVSEATVNFGLDFDNRDVLLTLVRSLEEVKQHNKIANRNISTANISRTIHTHRTSPKQLPKLFSRFQFYS